MATSVAISAAAMPSLHQSTNLPTNFFVQRRNDNRKLSGFDTSCSGTIRLNSLFEFGPFNAISTVFIIWSRPPNG
jgi:hypothetical protein